MSEPRVIDGRYVLESELGRGGMAVVHLARDIGLERRVALKLVEASGPNSATLLKQLRREASLLAKIRSEHVVQVYAFGTHERACYFAMEYVDGPTLETVLAEHTARGRTVASYRAHSILRQLAGGLDRVHAGGIIHRDIKPANIVIESDSGRPVLIDFGISVSLERTSEPNGGHWGGTPHYISPEQTGLRPPTPMTPRADVYSLACTAYELITGRVPFDGTTSFDVLRQHASAAPTLPSTLNAELLPFDRVFERALSKNPTDRHASASELVDDLDTAGKGQAGISLRDDFVAKPLASPVAAADEVITLDRDTERPPAAEALRVLVVDDDDTFRTFAIHGVRLGLAARLISVQSVSSGHDAIALATRRAPQLVLLDYDMPKMNGIETLARLRALPGGSDMRVIVISARARDLERFQFEVLGVRDFVEKPVGLKRLAAKIADVATRAEWL
jgi:eukaryotic-like serine/threonine-protein kinase